MARPTLRHVAVFLVILATVAVGGLVVDELRHSNSPDRTSVTFVGPAGSEHGTLAVRVAASYRERYIGLSNTESLGPNEGMLFVHDKVQNHSFVMRDMNFSIDIVFVGDDRRINRIYHARPEERPFTHYRGVSKWTIETPYNWTVRNGVSVGDRIRIDWQNQTATSGE